MTIRVLEKCHQISLVSQSAACEYAAKREVIRALVDSKMTGDPEVMLYIGHGSMELMYANHGYHVNFMANVFKYNNYELLARIAVWVYRSYHAHGFSYAYFHAALLTWQSSVRANLSEMHAKEISAVYQWMIDNHELLIADAESNACETFPISELDDVNKAFVELLLQGDVHSCLGLTMNFVQSFDKIADFYSETLQPCLYEIGRRWENGVISVAHEHMAVAIVVRIMTACYLQCKKRKLIKGRAIITTSPNEFHEIGARMIADIMEIEGWDVDYIGANTPISELMCLVREKRPQILGIAAVMPFNLEEVERIIHEVKGDCEMQKIKIMVGGLAFFHAPELAIKMGADAYVKSLSDALATAEKWWKEHR